MTKFAKPEEIQHAHSVLLKDKPYFEQDKIDIIECNESRDIKACPGSGKTTTLLAKLIILVTISLQIEPLISEQIGPAISLKLSQKLKKRGRKGSGASRSAIPA